jgi:hypothetical protein
LPKAWLCIPSARDEESSTVKLWRRQGYGVALFRDADAPAAFADLIVSGQYPGYACAVNRLSAVVLERDPRCSFVIAAGDDIQPDLNFTPDRIANECEEYFAGTFGVMQPVADRYGENEMHMGARGSAYVDRVCGSAWIGREFARRVNRGRGPLWPEYFHMGVDEELQAVATKLGVLWQRRDLIQYHQHWARKREKMPDFLKKANSGAEWDKYKKLFADRQKAGFPGSEVL